MHAEGSSRARSDDIPEITRFMACSVVVVVRGPEVGAIVDESRGVRQKASVG